MSATLVTGASTPLGRALLRRLLDDPSVHHVVGTGPEPTLPPPHLDPARFTWIQTDLTRARSVRRLLYGPVRTHGVQTVIHTAQHRAARDRGQRIHRLNVEATRLMLELAEDHDTVVRFVLRSYGEVYRTHADQPDILPESHPLDMRPSASQWVRDRVEADLTACARMGMSRLRVIVLRLAEVCAPGVGSQLHDYLRSRVCLRPIGFDPMVNLLSLPDAARALHLASTLADSGIYNIPGYDTLPLSEVIRHAGRVAVPLPGPALGPLYRLRALTRRTDFDYHMNALRLHFNGLLCGARAQAIGYTPRTPIVWTSMRDA